VRGAIGLVAALPARSKPIAGSRRPAKPILMRFLGWWWCSCTRTHWGLSDSNAIGSVGTYRYYKAMALKIIEGICPLLKTVWGLRLLERAGSEGVTSLRFVPYQTPAEPAHPDSAEPMRPGLQRPCPSSAAGSGRLNRSCRRRHNFFLPVARAETIALVRGSGPHAGETIRL